MFALVGSGSQTDPMFTIYMDDYYGIWVTWSQEYQVIMHMFSKPLDSTSPKIVHMFVSNIVD